MAEEAIVAVAAIDLEDHSDFESAMAQTASNAPEIISTNHDIELPYESVVCCGYCSLVREPKRRAPRTDYRHPTGGSKILDRWV